MISKCPACGENIEFEPEALGTASSCPFCDREITLQPPPPSVFRRAIVGCAALPGRFWRWEWRNCCVLFLIFVAIAFGISYGIHKSNVTAEEILQPIVALGVVGGIIFGIFQITKHGLWIPLTIAAMLVGGVLLLVSGAAQIVYSKTVFQEQSALLSVVGGCVIILLSLILHKLAELVPKK